jgi:hypothetical protein
MATSAFGTIGVRAVLTAAVEIVDAGGAVAR